MQLKGLALKNTPIDADSAVIRHERLQVCSKCCKKDSQNAKAKVEAMTSSFNQTLLLRV